MSSVISCDERRDIMWRCFAEDFEGLGKVFIEVLMDIRKTILEWECPRVVREEKEELGTEHVENVESGECG